MPKIESLHGCFDETAELLPVQGRPLAAPPERTPPQVLNAREPDDEGPGDPGSRAEVGVFLGGWVGERKVGKISQFCRV